MVVWLPGTPSLWTVGREEINREQTLTKKKYFSLSKAVKKKSVFCLFGVFFFVCCLRVVVVCLFACSVFLVCLFTCFFFFAEDCSPTVSSFALIMNLSKRLLILKF